MKGEEITLPPQIIISGHRHSRVYSPSCRHHDGSQATTLDFMQTGNHIYPEASFIVAGDFNEAHFRKTLRKFYQHIACNSHASKTLDCCYIVTIVMATRPSPAIPSANQITTPFCSSLPKGRTQTLSTCAKVYSTLVWPIRIHASILFWSQGLGYVTGWLWE
jgi:hypothetical protein